MKSKKLVKIVSLALLGATVVGINPMTANAAWKQNSTGWWYTEGNSWATGWRNINGAWYFFDGNGYMKTGWVLDKGTWYFLNPSGAMETGWILDRGTWYFLNPSGAMETGWILDRGTWYYLQSSGAMKTGWLSYKESWYFLKSSGAMASGEVIEYKGEKYYLEQSGAMVTGWKQINSDKYYFNGRGAAVKGEYTIGSDTYYFETDSCKLLINGTEGSYSTDSQGKIINGIPVVYEMKTIDGKTYLYKNGKKVTGKVQYYAKYYFFDKDGVMQKGWIIDESNKYYANKDGELVNGPSKIDGKLYLFDSSYQLVTKPGLYEGNSKEEHYVYKYYKSYVKEDGTLATGLTTVDNGKKYYFGEDGRAVSGLINIDDSKTPYYFDSKSYELICNANYYGLSTNAIGQVTKLNYETMQEDILKNNSEELKELEKKYGEITIKNKSFIKLEDEFVEDIIISEDESEKTEDLNPKEQVFTFDAIATEDGKEKVVNKYYVSARSGEIYVYKENVIYIDKLDIEIVNESLREIKNNKVVNYYVLDFKGKEI